MLPKPNGNKESDILPAACSAALADRPSCFLQLRFTKPGAPATRSAHSSKRAQNRGSGQISCNAGAAQCLCSGSLTQIKLQNWWVSCRHGAAATLGLNQQQPCHLTTCTLLPSAHLHCACCRAWAVRKGRGQGHGDEKASAGPVWRGGPAAGLSPARLHAAASRGCINVRCPRFHRAPLGCSRGSHHPYRPSWRPSRRRGPGCHSGPAPACWLRGAEAGAAGSLHKGTRWQARASQVRAEWNELSARASSSDGRMLRTGRSHACI